MKKFYALLILFSIGISFSFSQTKTPLYEVFTSSTCGPCKPGNEHMTPIYDQYLGQIAVIKYQMSWPGTGDPYFTDEAGNRRSYYGISGVPALLREGVDQSPTSLTSANIDDDFLKTALMEMELRYYVVADSQKVKIKARWEALQEIAGPSHRIFIAINEKRTVQNVKTNGETEFFHVFKKMLPTENGDIFGGTIATQQSKEYDIHYTFNGDFILPPNADFPVDHTIEHSVEDFNNLEVIMFGQNLLTSEIYNAAFGELVTGETDLNRAWGTPPSGVENVQFASNVSVFPNPASEFAFVEVGSKAQVNEVKLLDVLGNEVKTTQTIVSNRAKIDLDGVAKGMYLIQVSSTTGQSIERLIVK